MYKRQVLGHYRNVIWLGNNYNGDLASWQSTPVLSYLRAGGNLLLLSRMANLFIADSLRTYIGINTWPSTNATLNDCIATRPGLVNMTPLGAQTSNAVFDSNRTTPESQLLWRVSSGFTPNRGAGVIRIPAAGMGSRAHGGRFAFVAGRPYRWNHAQMQANTMTLLRDWFLEPLITAGVENGAPPAHLSLEGARPNPSIGTTALRFALPRADHVRLVLLDVAGRRVRTLVDGTMSAGPHDAAWDGRDASGALAPAGLYWARLESGSENAVRRVVRLK